MAGNGEVTIIVAAQDQTGSVMQAVSSNLARVQARAVSAGSAMVASGHGAVPAYAAASASVRVLDGDFSHLLRAEERFLASLPGVAGLMQAAFPIIGVLAVSEGLYRAGSAAYDFEQKASHAAETIRGDFADANLEIQKQNDSLRVSNDKLEQSIAKLEGKPRNGLAEALDEARQRADDLALSLIKDNQRVEELLKKDNVGFFAGLFTNQETTGAAEKLQKDYASASRQIVFAGQQREQAAKSADEAQAIRTQTQTQLYALQSKTLDDISSKLKGMKTKEQQDEEGLALYGDQYTPAKDNEAARGALQGVYSSISEQHDSIDLGGKNDQLQTEQKVAQAKHDQMEAQRTAAREAAEERRKEEEFLSRMQKLGVGGGQQAEYARQAQIAKALQESNKEVASSLDSTIEGIGKQWEVDAEAAVKSSREQIAALREVQDGRIKAAGDQYKNADQDSQFGVKTGKLNESQRFDALRSAANEEYQIKLNALEQIKALDAINPDDPQKVQRDLDQITELQTQYSRQMVTLTQQQVEQQKGAMDGYVKSIFDPLIAGTDTVSNRFKKMADNILGELSRVAESKLSDTIVDGLMGAKGGKSPGGAPSAPISLGGIGQGVGSLLGKLFGRKGAGSASNGGLATGAGTIADSTTSALQQGKGSSASSGVVVNIINQGTPQQASSSGSSGGGMEQQVISIVMKDADTLGPMSKALGGAINMLGTFS